MVDDDSPATSLRWLNPSRGSVNSTPAVLLIILDGMPATNSEKEEENVPVNIVDRNNY